MNDDRMSEALRAMREWLGPAMERSEPMRRTLRLLGEWLVEESRRAGEPSSEPAPRAPREASFPAAQPLARSGIEPRAAEGRQASRGIVPLRIGDVAIPLSVQGTTEEIGRARASAESALAERSEEPAAESAPPWWERAAHVDLALIEARSNLKARSCELYLERADARGDPDRERAVHAEIVEALRLTKTLPDCFLWVLWREREQPPMEAVGAISVCYRALAASARLVGRIIGLGESAGDDALRDAMALFAEASSALRVALEDTWLTTPDRDQDDSHVWLRAETARRHVFLPRFMTMQDPAEPGRASAVVDECHAFETRIAKQADAIKRVEALLKKVKYHASKSAAEDDAAHFDRIAEAVTALVSLGVPARDRRIAAALGPSIGSRFPEHLRTGPVGDALAAAGRFAAARATEPTNDTPRSRQWSERVAEVRALLGGRRMVLIGGEPRREAIERLEEAFACTIDWPWLTEHGRSDPMGAPIQHPDTAAVLLLIKLTGHLHADEARRYARESGRVCVNLPAGYSPEQVAEAVLAQAAARLEPAAGRRG
jgi:hypothetical protein